jgi:hypothetical protein
LFFASKASVMSAVGLGKFCSRAIAAGRMSTRRDFTGKIFRRDFTGKIFRPAVIAMVRV